MGSNPESWGEIVRCYHGIVGQDGCCHELARSCSWEHREEEEEEEGGEEVAADDIA